MLKSIFIFLFYFGTVGIYILSFIIPRDPYLIMPSITMLGIDYPICIAIMVFLYMIYYYTLWNIYIILEKKYGDNK